MAEKPYNLTYEPAPGEPRSNSQPDPHTVPIHDMRPVAGRLDFDCEGIALVQSRRATHDFYDEDEVRRVYYPECVDLVLAATGGVRAQVFDHTIRRRAWGGADRAPGVPRQPVTRVHNDYTVTSGPQRVRDLMGGEARRCSSAASRSSMSGGRSAGRCATPRWRSPMRAASRPMISSLPT